MSVGRTQAGALVGSLSSLIRTTRAAAQRHSGGMVAAGTPLAMLKALQCGATRPSDLASTLQVAPSVVSRTIVRLQEADLVDRASDPDDARASRIVLTDLGHARLDQLQQAHVEEVRAVLGSWTDAEAAQAASLMQRLDAAIALTYPDEAQRRLRSAASLPADPEPADLEPTDLEPTDVDDDPGSTARQPSTLASA